jgi:hypothetical protein
MGISQVQNRPYNLKYSFSLSILFSKKINVMSQYPLILRKGRRIKGKMLYLVYFNSKIQDDYFNTENTKVHKFITYFNGFPVKIPFFFGFNITSISKNDNLCFQQIYMQIVFIRTLIIF